MQATVEYDHCESFKCFTYDVEATAANEGDGELWHALAWNKRPNVGHVVLSPRISCSSNSMHPRIPRGTGILFRYDVIRIERMDFKWQNNSVADPMSALGHKQTYAAQQTMSASPPNSDRESRHPQPVMSAKVRKSPAPHSAHPAKAGIQGHISGSTGP